MPEMPELVVTNTTPIISLALVGKLSLLQQLYGQVFMPPAVQREVLVGGQSGIGVAELQQATWLKVLPLIDPSRADADLLADLDRGEAEAICLAQEQNASLLILDERLARQYAQNLGLTITGTLGVLLRAKDQKLIGQIRPLITQLRQGGIRLDEALIRRVLQIANE